MKVRPHSLARLNTLAGYHRSFMSTALWQPHIEAICRAHGMGCSEVRPGLAGTFPAFLVDAERVIKFFGPLFDGEICWRVELESAQMMGRLPGIPVARLLHSGVLEAEPAWHYLVFAQVPGVSIGEVSSEIRFEDRQSLARWLGGWLPSMHALKAGADSALPLLSEGQARGWFAARWQKDAPRWPPHLGAQVEEYIAAHVSSLPWGCESFIHADLTQDHLLGKVVNGRWQTLAVIDFGDAMLGNLYYELTAMHLDLFDCDRRLLSAFLHAYGFQPDPGFVHQAMVTSLLHQFDVYGPLFAWKPELRQVRSLDELADRLWNLDEDHFSGVY